MNIIANYLMNSVKKPSAQAIIFVGVALQWILTFRMVTAANTPVSSDIQGSAANSAAANNAVFVGMFADAIGIIIAIAIMGFAFVSIIIAALAYIDSGNARTQKTFFTTTALVCVVVQALASLGNLALAYAIHAEWIAAASNISNVAVIIAMLLNIFATVTCIQVVADSDVL